jgi:hypothetical protein
LNVFAIKAANVRVLSLVAVGQHHVLFDFVLGNFGHRTSSVALSLSARPKVRLTAVSTWHLLTPLAFKSAAVGFRRTHFANLSSSAPPLNLA